jgi:aerobic-type carbon monoxide dehydrogenase small subunit (CoxS/CutS family)
MLRHFLNIGNYELIFIGGSDFLQQNLLETIQDEYKYRIVLTNNKEICCGEGICGACIVYDADGVPIRSCKTQIKLY